MPDATDIASTASDATPIAPFIQGGLGLVEGITGLINAGKAKKEARLLEQTRPKYSITPESQDELSMAQSELSNGGSTGANAYKQLAGGDYANSVDAILKSGGGVNNIGDVYGQSENGRQKLALMQDELRMKNLNNLILAQRNMTDQRDKQFNFNEWHPWADKAQANAEARKGADAQIWGGLDTLGGGAMSFAQNKYEQGMWDKYLNPPQQPTATNPLWQSTTAEQTPTNAGGQTIFTPVSNNSSNNLTWGNPPDINGNNPYIPTPIQ